MTASGVSRATVDIFLAEHRPSGVPIDVSLAWLPFEEEAIAAAELEDGERPAILERLLRQAGLG